MRIQSLLTMVKSWGSAAEDVSDDLSGAETYTQLLQPSSHKGVNQALITSAARKRKGAWPRTACGRLLASEGARDITDPVRAGADRRHARACCRERRQESQSRTRVCGGRCRGRLRRAGPQVNKGELKAPHATLPFNFSPPHLGRGPRRASPAVHVSMCTEAMQSATPRRRRALDAAISCVDGL